MSTLTVEAALARNPEMFSDEANEAMRTAFTGLAEAAKPDSNGRVPTREALMTLARETLEGVAKTHGEAHDTEPEWWAADVTGAVLADMGYEPADRWDLF